MDEAELAIRFAEIADLQRRVDYGSVKLATVKDDILGKLFNIEIHTGVGGHTLYDPLLEWIRQGWMKSVPRNNAADTESWRQFLVDVRARLD